MRVVWITGMGTVGNARRHYALTTERFMPAAWTFLVSSSRREFDHESALIAAGLFFSIFAGGLTYFALSGTGHEYDLKFVLPIDTRKMPKPGAPPEIVSQSRTIQPIPSSTAARGPGSPRSAQARPCAFPTAKARPPRLHRGNDGEAAIQNPRELWSLAAAPVSACRAETVTKKDAQWL